MEPSCLGVYQDEMKPFGKISEQELDHLFSGKAPAGNSGLEDVSRLVQKVQSSFSTHIEPDTHTTQLAALMQLVHLTDKGDLAVRPASKVPGPGAQVSGLPKLRRRFMLETLFASLAAKIVAGGIAIAMAAVPVAATGNLPDQMQTGISRAVENIGLDIPVGDTAAAAEKASEVAEEEEVTDVDDGGVKADPKDPNENADFGQGVAADAKDGGVDGRQISEAAKARAAERKAAGQANRPEGAGPPADAGQSEDAGQPADAGQSEDAGPPADAGSQSQTGLDAAGDTPAASHLPTSVPGGRPAGVGGGRP